MKKTIIYPIFSSFFILLFAYAYFAYERQNLLNTLQSTQLEDITLTSNQDKIELSFYIPETHPQAAAYMYIRDQQSRQILIRDFIKIQNGMNSFRFEVEEKFSNDLYLSIKIKSFYKEDWKNEEMECYYNRGFLHPPFIPELTLCYDSIFYLPSFSLYTKD